MAVKDYLSEARKLLDLSYNTNVTNTKNEAANAIQNYDNQKGGINLNYDTQSANALTNTGISKNNFSNNNLSRGMGRSSIATTGIAQIGLAGDKVQNNITQNRTNDLNNIENLKNLISSNLASKLNAMSADYETSVLNKADEMKRYDDEQAFKQKQYQDMLAQQAWDNAFREKQLSMSRSGGSGGSGGGGGGSSRANNLALAKEDIASFGDHLVDIDNYLTTQKSALIAAIGVTEYNKLLATNNAKRAAYIKRTVAPNQTYMVGNGIQQTYGGGRSLAPE